MSCIFWVDTKRFAATRSWWFRRRKLLVCTELDASKKLHL